MVCVYCVRSWDGREGECEGKEKESGGLLECGVVLGVGRLDVEPGGPRGGIGSSTRRCSTVEHINAQLSHHFLRT